MIFRISNFGLRNYKLLAPGRLNNFIPYTSFLRGGFHLFYLKIVGRGVDRVGSPAKPVT